MKNLMRAQLYQLPKKRYLYLIYFAILLLELLNLFFFHIDRMEESGLKIDGSYYLAMNGYYMVALSIGFAFVLVAEICSGDFMDKTSYFEILGGYTRREIYLSRACLGIALGFFSVLILWLMPLLAASLVGGWGDSLLLTDAILRLLLACLPVLRILCECTAICFLVKNAYLVAGVGFLASMMSQALAEMENPISSSFLGCTNLIRIFRLESFRTYTVHELKMNVIYDAGLTADLILPTVAASLFFGAMFLLLGYVYYHTDDLS